MNDCERFEIENVHKKLKETLINYLREIKKIAQNSLKTYKFNRIHQFKIKRFNLSLFICNSYGT